MIKTIYHVLLLKLLNTAKLGWLLTRLWTYYDDQTDVWKGGYFAGSPRLVCKSSGTDHIGKYKGKEPVRQKNCSTQLMLNNCLIRKGKNMNGLNPRRMLDEALAPSPGMIKVKAVSKIKGIMGSLEAKNLPDFWNFRYSRFSQRLNHPKVNLIENTNH